MILLCDTRQQSGKHDVKNAYFRSKGIVVNRTKLYAGDYALSNDQGVCVDTKKDVAELILDIQFKNRMSKKDVRSTILEIAEKERISSGCAEEVFHAICDDDAARFAEKDINEVCYKYSLSEIVIDRFQALYVKRHGFFHRGLKRAQNSEIQLYILVENKQGVTCINDLNQWHNPRLDIMVNGSQVIGCWKNGKPRYEKVQKYPYAATGEWLAKACLTMEQKYGVVFKFTTPENSGKMILELLGVNL